MKLSLFLGIFLICGIAGYLFTGPILRRLLQKVSKQERVDEVTDSILTTAQERRDFILDQTRTISQEQHSILEIHSEEQRQIKVRIQESYMKELDFKEADLLEKEEKINGLEFASEEKKKSISSLSHGLSSLKQDIENKRILLKTKLEEDTHTNTAKLEEEFKESLLAAERLDATKWLLENQEQLKKQSEKFAKQTLEAVYTRYQPRFIWPKIPFTVIMPRNILLEHFSAENSSLIPLLTEGLDTKLEPFLSPDETHSSLLKIAGGLGTDKEVLRLTLEEMIHKGIYNKDKILKILQKNKHTVEQVIIKLGHEAIKILDLKPMHSELLRLVGSLNYRTSHRQNQYYHTLEVARLAGMLAKEIGVDDNIAKRSGLLHDIGKVLDYKIEGSHAVISGDYATRYGESECVVDTVLAHHDDKIVETPHAYILKAADAMSGARPGARVDMEEGYNKRIDGISMIIQGFQEQGVVHYSIMHAGREIYIYVDNHRTKENELATLASSIARKLESEIEFPGQIKVTAIRRLEISEVA